MVWPIYILPKKVALFYVHMENTGAQHFVLSWSEEEPHQKCTPGLNKFHQHQTSTMLMKEPLDQQNSQ